MPLQVVGSSLMKQTGLSVREFVMRVAPPFAIKFSEINHQTGIKVVPVHFWWGTRITLRHWLLHQPHSHYLAFQLGRQTNLQDHGVQSTEFSAELQDSQSWCPHSICSRCSDLNELILCKSPAYYQSGGTHRKQWNETPLSAIVYQFYANHRHSSFLYSWNRGVHFVEGCWKAVKKYTYIGEN